MIRWKEILRQLMMVILPCIQSVYIRAAHTHRNKVITCNIPVKANVALRKNDRVPALPIITTEHYLWQGTGAGLIGAIGAGLIFSIIIILCLYRLYRRGKQEVILNERIFLLKRTIRELCSHEKKLTNENYLQEQSIFIILHDIRSPLAYLLSSIRQFNRQLEHLTIEETREFISSLLGTSERITRLVDELVQWQFSWNRQELRYENIHLQSFLNDIKELYEGIAKVNSNVLSVEVAQDIYIYTDRSKLSLIFRNLVDNANKYCRNGSIVLSGKLSVSNSVVTISVTDTGPGIKEECVKEFIQPFIKVPDLRKDKLGLILIKYFIELMGATCAIITHREGGTTIAVDLPIIENQPPPFKS